MAIPTSGQIGVSQHLNRELGRSINAQFSIDTAENGGYGTINRNSRSRPSPINPASFSEWYGYDHDAGSGPGPGEYGFMVAGYSSRGINDFGGQVDACAGRDTARIFWEDPNRAWYTVSIYLRADFNIFAVPGWYSDQPEGGGFTVRYWRGDRWSSMASLCTI